MNKKLTLGVVAFTILVVLALVVTSAPKETEKPVSNNQGVETTSKPPQPIVWNDNAFDEETRIFTSPDLTGNSFNKWGKFKYQIKLPKDWIITESNYLPNENVYGMRLAYGNTYFIDFSYGDNPSAPITCGFSDVEESQFHYEKINQYQEISAELGTLRIGESTTGYSDSNIFRVCQYSGYKFTTETSLGRINIIEPHDAEVNTHTEILQILQSIKILKQ